MSIKRINIPFIGQGIGEYSWDYHHSDLIRKGIDEGSNLIDTCEIYNNGISEEVIGEAVKGVRDKVIILTKFGVQNSSYNKIIKAAEGSLKRLKTDYIDIYQSHWPSISVPIIETIGALLNLVKQGKIRTIGIGNPFSLEELKKIYEISEDNLSSIQIEYNLFDRTVEDIFFPFCKEKNIRIIAYSPLDKGRFVNSEKELLLLKKIARRYNKKVSQIVLNWLINKNEKNVSVIPKASTKEHIIENSESLSFSLSGEEIKEIDEICRTEIEWIPTDKIQVALDGEGNKTVYSSIEEAIRNELNFCPSPYELSSVIKNNSYIKPVRLIKTDNDQYKLVEGRIRYWAYVIAKGKSLIPSLIRKKWGK